MPAQVGVHHPGVELRDREHQAAGTAFHTVSLNSASRNIVRGRIRTSGLRTSRSVLKYGSEALSRSAVLAWSALVEPRSANFPTLAAHEEGGTEQAAIPDWCDVNLAEEAVFAYF